MRGLILAAGRGSRMGELTNEHPKCLTKVRGRSLLERQLSAFSTQGISQVGIVTGYKAECLENYGTVHIHNSQWATTNMVFSMLCALDWLAEDDCIVSYGDIFFDDRLIVDLQKSKRLVAIAYDPNWLDLWRKRFSNPLDDAESFRMKPDGTLADIGRKSASLEDIQGQYMGLLLFRKEFWSGLSGETYETLFMTDFIRSLSQEISIDCVPNPYTWGEVDSASDLLVYA